MDGNPLFFHEDFVEGAQKWQEEIRSNYLEEGGHGEEDGGNLDIEENFLEECNYQSYSKIKYLKSVDTIRNYLEDYEENLFRDKMLLEVILQLDPFKITSERVSINVLDFLGDLGGFY